MDIKSLLKKLDISALKVGFYLLFNRESLFEYIASKANTAVNALMIAHESEVNYIRAQMLNISAFLNKYYRYVPAAWQPYADDLNSAFRVVYDATADLTVTTDEAKSAISAFQIAFSRYVSDEIEAE